MGYILTTGTEPDILETIRFVALVRGSHEVIVARSAREILQRARRDRPSLAVWDLGFNDRRENQHLSQWYADSTLQSVPLVLLTSAGATSRHTLPSPLPDGTICLIKPIDPIELGLRVGALLDPEYGRYSPPVSNRRQVGDLVLDYQLFEVRASDRTVSLTPTEFKLLRHLMENAGQTFSSEQLLDEVWKYPPGAGSVDVVRMYVKRLRDKIESEPRKPQYIVTVPGHGYRMPMPETTSESTDGHPPAQRRSNAAGRPYKFGIPSTAIDGPLQEILLALQAVILTCQATLTTMAHLMDKLSASGDNLQHIRPATLRQPLTATTDLGTSLSNRRQALRRAQEGPQDTAELRTSPSTELRTSNGTRDKVHPGHGRRAQDVASPISHLLYQPNPAVDDIDIAAQSLNGLVAELQATLTQLQAGWPGADSQPVSTAKRGAMRDGFTEGGPDSSAN